MLLLMVSLNQPGLLSLSVFDSPHNLMKRAFDFVLALLLLIILSPLLVLISVLVFTQDWRSPLYLGERVGMAGRHFRMIKFRSMITDADSSGVSSTSATDVRITRIGAALRRFKLDELPQLINILRGEMSFVGPRPNVALEVNLYSDIERGLLDIRPGVTDFASIVFADEGEIIRGSPDPDRDYNLLIRPGKSRLGLHYVRSRSLAIDIQLMALTALAPVSGSLARRGVVRILESSGADKALQEIASRSKPLQPDLPPGVAESEWERHLNYDQ